jgi:hypothetical protein
MTAACRCCIESRFTVDALCWCPDCHGESVPVKVEPATVEEWDNALRKWRTYAEEMREIAADASADAIEYVAKHVRERRDKGVTCPGCGQFAKVYKRKVNSGMARSLIAMYRAGGTTWVDVTEVTDRRSREEGKLAYWGLVEEFPEGREDGGRPGMWRVTNLGRSFVLGNCTVPQTAEVYNGMCLRTYGPDTSIVTALGDKFDYRELMGS